MKTKLLTLALLLTTVSCQASYTRPPYTLGQKRCEALLLPNHVPLDVCEITVAFERTCLLAGNGAAVSVPCKFYDEVVRAPKIVR